MENSIAQTETRKARRAYHMKRFAFLKESLRHFKTVGTVTRSSRYLSRGVVRQAKISEAKVVVELGVGDGVMTRHILKTLPADAVLFSFEVNAQFCKQMMKINDPRLKIINLSAEKLPEVIGKYGFHQVDAVISALPFSVFPLDLTYTIVGHSFDVLKENHRFVQIHYSLKTKKIYSQIFGNIKSFFEFRNIPPAFILVCEKQSITKGIVREHANHLHTHH